jgi:hypothetical protein
MATRKLHPCMKCKMASEHLQVTESSEWEHGSVLTKFYIRCGCKEHLMFDSEKEAITAWNKANPVKS